MERKELEAWLEGREQDDAVAIASRAALRVLPLVSDIFTSSLNEPRANLVLPVLRATIVSRLAALPKSRALSVANAAHSAHSAALSAGSALSALSADSAAYAALSALSADSVAASAPAYAANSANSAALSAAVWREVSADVLALEQGTDAATLAASPLWQDTPPKWVAKDWGKVTAALREAEGENWAFWIDWYEARLRGEPINTALDRAIVLLDDDIWEEGPAVVNAKILELVAEHSGPPKTPAQEPAPVTAEIRDGEISRRDPDAPAHEEDMAKIHGLLLTEAQWLSSNLSAQHGAICDMVGNTVTALGDSYAETDALTLGFHSKPIASRAKTANEDLLEDQAAKLQGFSANLDLFVLRLQDWRTHIAKAAENPVTPEEVEAAAEATKSLLDGIRQWSKDLYDERIPAMLDELYLSLSESSVYGVETPYGFYLSLRNVLTITMQAAINAIPPDLIREESDEVVKSLRKSARKFVQEYAAHIAVVSGIGLLGGLKAAFQYILGLL